MRKKAFISYSHEDSDLASELNERLKGSIDLFYDSTTIGWGTEWARELENGLDESDYFIPCLSPTYLESVWCKKEIQLFMKGHRQDIKGRVFPVLLKPIDGGLPPPLNDIQYIDLSTPGAISARLYELYRALHLWPPVPAAGTKCTSLKKPIDEEFVGRFREIWAIHDTLHDKPGGQCVVTGMGGVGKSQLAIEYANRFDNLYEGGNLWLNAEHILDHDDLDMEIITQIQGRLTEKTPAIDQELNREMQLPNLLQKIRGDKQLLIVFDNFPEKGDLEPCLRLAGPGIFAIVTTRTRIEGEHEVYVKPMDIRTGIEILNSGKRQFGQEVEALVERLGGLPLALALAKGYLNRPPHSVDKMIAMIDSVGEIESCKTFESQHRKELQHHARDIVRTFKLSYDQIVSTIDREIIHCLCLMQPLGVPTEFLSEVLGPSRGEEEAEQGWLDERIGALSDDWGIIDVDKEEDPVVHRLVRSYVALRLGEQPALYEHFSNLVASALDRNAEAALGWKGKEVGLGRSDTEALDEQVRKKRIALAKLVPHGEEICKGGSIKDALAAHILCNLGRIREMLGNKAKAVSDLKVAADMAAEVGDKLLEAKARSYLGVSMFHNGDFVGSIDELVDAKKAYDELHAIGGLDIDDLVAYGTCLDYIGENLREQGDYKKAFEAHQGAINVAGTAEDRRLKSLEAHANAQIGAIHLRREDYDKAIDFWTKSLAISEAIGDAPWMAHFCIDVGFVHLLNGDAEEARYYLKKGTKLAKNGGYQDNVARGLMNLGSAHFVSGDHERARKEYEDALPIAKENQVVRLTWRIEYNLGNVFRARGELKKAKQRYSAALRTLENLRDNYKDRDKKAKFMEHRLRPYQTMIMLALDPKATSPEGERIFGDSEMAREYVERGLHGSLDEFRNRAEVGLSLEKERENDKNFFIVDGKGYFVETE